jgi:UDP-N-acetylmuramate--alanine ligase
MKELLPKVRRRFITYGLGDGLDLVAKNIRCSDFSAVFDAELNGKLMGTFEVPLAGEHNISNCIAAIAVANELGMKCDDIKKALKNFSGVQRRLEMKGTVKDIGVIDDYGHHPAEIMATLKAVKEAMLQSAEQQTQNTDLRTKITDDGQRTTGQGRLVVLFQPHRYTRTRDLLGEFIDAFGYADKVLLMDIYSAGEKPLPGVNSELLYRGMKEINVNVEYVEDRDQVQNCLEMELKRGDILLTLGAGDVWKEGEEFIQVRQAKDIV